MTEQQLLKLWEDHRVPLHIRLHMKKVAAVAMLLGQKINQHDIKVDLVKLRQAALLHDMLKIGDIAEQNFDNYCEGQKPADVELWKALRSKMKGQDHMDGGFDFFMNLNEPVIALMIKRHRFEGIIDLKNTPRTIEEKILYYADKRVKHDQLVALEERLHDGKQRYYPNGDIPADQELIEKAVFKLEHELCLMAQILPAQINEQSIAAFLE